MLVLINIILVLPDNKITLPDIYSFNRIQKVLFVIRVCLTWFHVTLILHILHFVMQTLSRMKFGYLLMGIKLVSTYWMKMT